jgi:hypothetical protein
LSSKSSADECSVNGTYYATTRTKAETVVASPEYRATMLLDDFFINTGRSGLVISLMEGTEEICCDNTENEAKDQLSGPSQTY